MAIELCLFEIGCNFEDFYSFFIRSDLDAIAKDLKTLKIIREKAGMSEEEPSIFGQPFQIASNETDGLLDNDRKEMKSNNFFNNLLENNPITQTYKILEGRRQDMVKANIKDSDNYFHTLAMCEASNAGFPRETIALFGGLVKEVIDLWKKSPYTDNYRVKKISTLDTIKDGGKDMLNNLVGLFLGKIIDENYTCEEVLKLDKPKGKNDKKTKSYSFKNI